MDKIVNYKREAEFSGIFGSFPLEKIFISRDNNRITIKGEGYKVSDLYLFMSLDDAQILHDELGRALKPLAEDFEDHE